MELNTNTNKLLLKKFTACINIELLFDFKSLLYSIIRQFNEKHNLRCDLKQNLFKSLNFSKIEEYSEYFSKFNDEEEIDSNNFGNSSLKMNINEFILKNNLFETVKPKLLFTTQFYFLNNLIKRIASVSQSHDNNLYNTIVYVYTEEEFYLKFIDGKMKEKLKSIFEVENLIFTEKAYLKESITKNNDNHDKDDSLTIIFNDKNTTDLLCTVELDNQHGNKTILFHKEENNNSENNINNNFKICSKFEELLEYLCKTYNYDYNENNENYKGKK
jgi:hypothetical protein